eukprot:jgi/Orpsp1_1/1184946/evm.model.c7180000091682.1
MLFCPQIRSVKLDDNGEILFIERGESIKINEVCQKLALNIRSGENDSKRTFIYSKIDEPNKKLSERFESERNLRICCAIELDNDNNVFVDKASPCLFCSLPLVGSEKHELPFIINSPDFEPDTERQSLLLDGIEFNIRKNKISDPGINKMILLKSKKLFENILNYICNNDIGKRYLLTRGLRSLYEIQNFDSKWYEENFTNPIRDILVRYPIVWNSQQFIILNDAYLPKIKDYENSQNQQKAYIPVFDQLTYFEESVFENNKNLNYITIEDCVKLISSYNNMDSLNNKFKEKWVWIDTFLSFLNDCHPDYLKKYNIIPNMNSEFVKLTNDLKTSKNVPENMIECLEALGNPWKSKHIHKNICDYTTGTDHGIDDAVSTIRSYLKNWSSNYFIIISYIPYDNTDKKFIKKRNTLFELCSKIWNNTIYEKKNGNSFPEELWNGVDDIIFKELIRNIENAGKLDNIYNIDFIEMFLECALEYYPLFKNYSIIPNKNGKFCRINELYEDMNIPDLFKNFMMKCFNKDINEELIDNRLKSLDILLYGRKRYIYDYVEDLNDYFQSNDISKNTLKTASEYLIRIIPKKLENLDDDWQNNQRKLFEIYKIFTKANYESIEIERNDNNKGLWKFCNKYICENIKNIIENYNSIGELEKALNIDNFKVYECLKVKCTFNLEGKTIPNQYEELCTKNVLYNEGYDIRKYLVHQRMGRLSGIEIISKKDINSTLDDLIDKKLGKSGDLSEISDTKFKNAASNMLINNFENIKNNPFESDRMNIFYKVYLANVNNRLRELENPKDVDCKRWVWELIQNAKDSIVGQEDRNGVDIEILVKEDTYIFRHNGEPFTMGTLTALLYKFSEGKSNNSESTGRFGTGFLTTHSLSKNVKISGEIISDSQSSPKGFTVTMYREGEGEELLNGLKETEKSFTCPIESDGWTSFEYTTKTKENRKAGQLGIENFKINIEKTMLFCPEIRSIKLDNNGNIFEIKRGDAINNFNDDEKCHKLTLDITDGEKNFKREFLYSKFNEPNNELSEKFNTERNLRIWCAIELDDENNIIINTSSPCLFCSLPLVGSEKHELPFIINSPDFEPDSERQSIFLNGNEIDIKTGKISNPGINKMILLKSQEIYKILLNSICKNNIKKRYLLARGLQKMTNETNKIENFDYNWYEKNFTQPMRNILIKYPLAWNGSQFVKITQINLPMTNNYESIETQKKAYSFISKICNHNVPTFDESTHFEKYIWKNDDRLFYITMKECVQVLSSCENMKNLNSKINSSWEWMNDFLLFIKDFHYDYLKKYSLIPNMNSEFVLLNDDLTTSRNVPDNMIECLESLGNPWKTYHIHKNIKSFTTSTDHNIKYAVSEIRNYIFENLNKILILISYIPNDCKNKDFVEKRKTIYELCSKIWGSNMSEIKDGNSFPEELWNKIDDIIFDIIINLVEKSKKISDIFTIEFMKKFLECVSKYYPTFKMHSIIPNKNGKFYRTDE